jgi:glycosyltransferase involved in cell wall biosynthesis
LPPSGRPRVYYDATLVIGFGLEPPVGVVRVDRYVAELLAHDPTLDLSFVIFDAASGGFRDLTSHEAALLDRILFHCYEPPVAAEVPQPPPFPPEPEPGPEPEPEPEPEPITARLLLRRLRTASTLPAPEFDRILTQYAARLLPVTPRQSLGRRAATRIARGIVLFGARRGHFVVYRPTVAARSVRAAGRHLIRPDPAPAQISAGPDDPPRIAGVAPAPCDDPAAGSRSGEADPRPPPCAIGFREGDVLLSLSNAWDYMDYAYLHRICRDDRVRLVSVVYDVIAMQFPFSTPGPMHIYHRHWIEIGHSAAHLLAISKFSADQYLEFIGEPNGLFPPLSYAYLPSFPRPRADEIGEAPVVQLLGRRFVVFCSTIETRKNHQLLLQLWDRLRLEFSHDELPILVFVGRWGWGAETVRLQSERNFHLRGHLLILNHLSDAELIWIYRNARFTLFPALSEGYGLAAAESLSFGTPVVISDCPALVEATEGLMPAHDPLDFMAWLAEMRGLIRDDLRLDELRAAAARYRGPAYDAFANAIRAIAVAVSQPAAQLVEAD